MKILQNSDKQLVVAMKDSITILSDDKTLVSVDKEIVCAAANTLGILDDIKIMTHLIRFMKLIEI